jgi:murein DD-endopeptidase MepM/ murein hydrolase activator NlpD
MTRAAFTLKDHSRFAPPKRSFRWLKVLGACAVLTGVLSFFGLLDLPDALKSHLPFSCSIAPIVDPGHDEQASCPVPEPGVCAIDADTRGEPVEISDMTSAGDSLLSLLSLNLCDAATASRVAESLAVTMQNAVGKRLRSCDELKSGMQYAICLDEKGAFRRATFEWDASNVFHCTVEGDTVRSWKEDVVLEYKPEVLCFRMQKDLVTSLRAAREDKALASKLIHVFQWDIDFQADSCKGDLCKVVFERRYADDKPAGYGRVLFAVYEGKRAGRKTACLFNNEYFDEHGTELRKNYLRTPLNTLRITSGFGFRVHPVLQVWKMHTGVDYGAPVGTPVYAISNGTVTFQGWGDAYGLYVCIRHENGYESRYSHLSKILVKTGQKVKQRQTVGLVGSTGRSTGPHLFFEIIANGKHLDPTKVKMIKIARSIPSPLKGRFQSIVNRREQDLMDFVKIM